MLFLLNMAYLCSIYVPGKLVLYLLDIYFLIKLNSKLHISHRSLQSDRQVSAYVEDPHCGYGPVGLRAPELAVTTHSFLCHLSLDFFFYFA